jgi:hypothetical protein
MLTYANPCHVPENRENKPLLRIFHIEFWSAGMKKHCGN